MTFEYRQMLAQNSFPLYKSRDSEFTDEKLIREQFYDWVS